MENNRYLSSEQTEYLFRILESRFKKNMHRHGGINWDMVYERLNNNMVAQKLWSLNEMEKSGGEPDVVWQDAETGEFVFIDCSLESPKARRSICYDQEALNSRKENKPKNNVIDMATSMGIELLTEEQYRELQKIEHFDLKTSSWVKTPSDIRKRGGAIFCDCRYNHVFVYHNGAESYYAARGFRGLLKV